MLVSNNFAYVQARLQARHGKRPDSATWSQLDSTIDVPGLIHLVRSTSLASWMDSVQPTPDVHVLERTLRHRWLRHIDTVAGWSPQHWRNAIRWVGTSILLPSLHHARSGNAPPQWTADDPTLLTTLNEPSNEVSLHFKGLPISTLINSAPDQPLSTVWYNLWRSLWPSSSKQVYQELQKLMETVETHHTELATLKPTANTAKSRSKLRHELKRGFRRGAQTPSAVFCYLGLCALDLQRLRGNLVTRALFPRQPEMHQWQ